MATLSVHRDIVLLWLHYQFIDIALLCLHHQFIRTLFCCALLWLHCQFILVHHDLSIHIYQDHFRWKNYIHPPTSAVTLNPGGKTEHCHTTTKHKEATRVNCMHISWDILYMIVWTFYLTRFGCWCQISSWLSYFKHLTCWTWTTNHTTHERQY